MTEEQIRAFVAHIVAVRDRWGKEVRPFVGDYLDLDLGRDQVEFIECDYDYKERDSIPLLAFVDFDAAARPRIAAIAAERERQALAKREYQEQRDRAEYARLKAKYDN